MSIAQYEYIILYRYNMVPIVKMLKVLVRGLK